MRENCIIPVTNPLKPHTINRGSFGTQIEIPPKADQTKSKSDWIYHPPTDLEATGGTFGSKPIGKWHFNKISLRIQEIEAGAVQI